MKKFNQQWVNLRTYTYVVSDRFAGTHAALDINAAAWNPELRLYAIERIARIINKQCSWSWAICSASRQAVERSILRTKLYVH